MEETLLLIENQKNIPSFLLYEYNKIGLTEGEAFLLIRLFPLQREFDLEKYANILNIPPFLLLEEISLLQTKGFLEISMVEINGMYSEVLSFLPLVKKYLSKDELKDQKSDDLTKDLANMIEKTFARSLNTSEIQFIKKWLFIENIEVNDIINAVNLANLNNAKSLAYVDKILLSEKEEELIQIDLF